LEAAKSRLSFFRAAVERFLEHRRNAPDLNLKPQGKLHMKKREVLVFALAFVITAG
jgi:hypothetical protein